VSLPAADARQFSGSRKSDLAAEHFSFRFAPNPCFIWPVCGAQLYEPQRVSRLSVPFLILHF